MAGKGGASGGKREGAGAKYKYGEPVERITVQIPKSKVKMFKTLVTKFLKPFIVKKSK